MNKQNIDSQGSPELNAGVVDAGYSYYKVVGKDDKN